MKVAILGASGQLGGKTLEAVIERGVPAEDTVAAVRTPDKLAGWASKGVDVRRADYDEPESLKSAFEGVERVLLVPSFAPPPERARQYSSAIDAAREAGVRHLYHYGLVPTRVDAKFLITPFLVYAESALRTSGLDWTILRNSLYADPIADWVPSIVEMGTIPYPTGEGRCAYISRADIGRAGAAALVTDGHAGKAYDLTAPVAVTTAELCDIVARVTGETVEHRQATDQDYVDVCLKEGESEFMARALLTLYHTIRDGHVDVATDHVEQLSGAPADDFETYLRRRIAADS